MQEKLVSCFNEMNDTEYETLEQIKYTGYSRFDVLDAYLRYEGIAGYTATILEIVSETTDF